MQSTARRNPIRALLFGLWLSLTVFSSALCAQLSVGLASPPPNSVDQARDSLIRAKFTADMNLASATAAIAAQA